MSPAPTPRGLPRDPAFDSTFAMLRDPQGFIGERRRRLGTDAFETRLALRPFICLSGAEGAELFYDPARFVRAGAMPGPVGKTVFGRGGVQGLDGEAHRHRKAMLLSLMTPQRIGRLSDLAVDEWQSAVAHWPMRDRVVVDDEVRTILTRTVCAWAGVPLAEPDVDRRALDLALLFEGAFPLSWKHWQARLARRRLESWAAGLVTDTRSGRFDPPHESALAVIARHQDLDDGLLSPTVAAVELLNVLRPTVAVSGFITFAALALHDHPVWRSVLAEGGEAEAESFSQEVRRFYPFAPFVAARVVRDFTWRGYAFPAGRMTLLDLYGTNHDQRFWGDPYAFRPERFRDWPGNLFDFVPQGGGDGRVTHRCPGEWITIKLQGIALDFLARRLSYEVPAQDLRIDRSALPPLPPSGFAIDHVRLTP